jgi:hypothetical protein
MGDGEALNDLVVGCQGLTAFGTMVLGGPLNSYSGGGEPVGKRNEFL